MQDGKGKKEVKKADKTDKDGKEAPLPAGVKGRGWRESVGPRPIKDLSGEQPMQAEEHTKRREYNCMPAGVVPVHLVAHSLAAAARSPTDMVCSAVLG